MTLTDSLALSFSSMVARPTTHLLLSLSLGFQPSRVVPLKGVIGLASSPLSAATARAVSPTRRDVLSSRRFMGCLLVGAWVVVGRFLRRWDFIAARRTGANEIRSVGSDRRPGPVPALVPRRGVGRHRDGRRGARTGCR